MPKAGRYRLRVLASAAPDFGIVRAALDGKSLGAAFDLYAGRVCPAGSLELGTFEMPAGPHRLRVTAVGKNAASQGFAFGLDALDLLVRSLMWRDGLHASHVNSQSFQQQSDFLVRSIRLSLGSYSAVRAIDCPAARKVDPFV